MNKGDLIREVAGRTASSQSRTARIVNEFVSAIGRSLSDGHRVDLRRFGAFDLRRRHSRSIRNPRNGRTYHVPGKLTPIFRSSRTLVESVDEAHRRR
jgi:nucleoid DNA-binding protein